MSSYCTECGTLLVEKELEDAAVREIFEYHKIK